MTKSVNYGIKLDPQEREGLSILSAREGEDTIAGIVRRLIRRELIAHGLYTPQPRPVRRGRPVRKVAA